MALGTPVAAAAAYSAASGTTVAPAYPTGILTTDAVVLFVGMKPTAVGGGTVTTPTGWTLQDSLINAGGYTAQGADTGNSNLYAYTWNAPVAGQSGNLTVTIGGNNVTWAFIVRVPTGGGALSYGSADGQRTTTPTSPMAIALTNGASATNFQNGDLALWAMCIPTDVTTPSQFSAQSITATGATFGTAVEMNEPDSTTGNDIGGYSARAAVTAGSSTTAPTVTVTLAGTLTNVRGPVVLLRVREGPLPQTLTPTLYTNTQTFHNPTVTPGAVDLLPALYTNDQTFFAPTVAQVAGAQTLVPDLYTNAQAFFAPAVSATYALAPALYTNAQTFFAPTVSATYALTPALYSNAQTFFAPTVSATYALAPARYDNAQTFYGAVVTQSGGVQLLLPDLYSNAQTFFSASVARGAVTLTPSLVTNSQTFYAATVSTSATLAPTLVTNDQTFYAPAVSAGVDVLTPSLVTNTQVFFAPTATPGVVVLSPQGYVDPGYVDTGYVGPNTFSTQVFFAPTATPGAVTLQPSLAVNASAFFAPVVELNSFVITKAQALRLLQIHLLHGLGASPLVVGASSRSAGPVEQSVSQAGTTVTISTSAGPTVFVGDAGLMIDELAALHGLTADLVVTPTSRTAGTISQSLAQSGTTTTVARV